MNDYSYLVMKKSGILINHDKGLNLHYRDEIDVNWENLITANISQYINMNFNIGLL